MMGESLRKKPVVSAGAVQKAYEPRILHALIFASTFTTTAMAQAPGPQRAAQPPKASEVDTAAARMAASREAPSQAAQGQPSSPSLDKRSSGEADLDERAQRHWGSGMAYLDEDDYAKALEAFNKAFELSGRPRILLAIAVTHERRGDLAQAIATLDEYLRLAPNAANAASISTHRSELQAQLDDQLQRMSEAKKDEANVARPAEPGAVAESPHFSNSNRDTSQVAGRSQRSDTLKWAALGVGVASGVAAAVSGGLALKEYNGLERECGAGLCSDRETQTGRTMAWVSTVLTGVAVVGLGVGVWLTLDEPDAAVPQRVVGQHVRVGLAYRSSGLTSEVSWSF